MSRLLVWRVNLEISAFPVAVNFTFTVTVFSSPVVKSKPVTLPLNVAEPKHWLRSTVEQDHNLETRHQTHLDRFLTVTQTCLSPAAVVNP